MTRPDPFETPRCRECGTRVRVRADATAGKHAVNGSPCLGVGLPIAGEPPCVATCRYVGTIGYPVPYQPGQSHASTVVCDSPRHQAEASAWVESLTGHSGVYQPFERTVRAS